MDQCCSCVFFAIIALIAIGLLLAHPILGVLALLVILVIWAAKNAS